MRYIAFGWPPALPDDFLLCFLSHQRPSFSEIHERADRGRLHTTDDGSVLFVRQPTQQLGPDSQRLVGRAACLLNYQSIRIYVPLLMRPRVLQACHSAACGHLGTKRILRLLERFNWWIGRTICTRW